MGTTVRLRGVERLVRGALRALGHLVPGRKVVSTGGWASPGDDDGSAGVREPRRPKPDLPTLSAEEHADT